MRPSLLSKTICDNKGQKTGSIPLKFNSWVQDFQQLILAEKAKNGSDEFFKNFSQVLVMFLFSVLDFKDSNADESTEFSLLIEDPLKVTACARCIVETSYNVLMQIDLNDST